MKSACVIRREEALKNLEVAFADMLKAQKAKDAVLLELVREIVEGRQAKRSLSSSR